MARLTAGSVVVVTGASSGIGRAAALEFARLGMRLVLASRSQQPLEETASECRSLGGETIPVVTDMTDPNQVEALHAAAVARFLRVDVWVNCAAVLLFGRFEEMPPATIMHVIDNNISGYVHGSQAALKQFRLQDNEGVLINVGSMLGVVPEPFVSAYSASKYAIRGLTACIRQEVLDSPGIRVVTILPSAIDTPIYQKAGNLFGRRARSIAPVYRTQRAASVIVHAASKPRREPKVGGFALVLDVAARLTPGLLESILGRLGPRLQFEDRPHPPDGGNLYEGKPPFHVTGGWRDYWIRKIKAGGKEPPLRP